MLRLIARLDVKGENLVKSIQFEGIRILGLPHEYASHYYEQGVDEIIYNDCVASLYGRNNLVNILQRTAREVFIPITAGGGVRSVEDASILLRCGADKVSVNTAAVENPNLISQIARRFGSQCMVLSIEAKSVGDHWEVYTNNGRECTGLDVVDWAKRAVKLGAGEILLTSVDREGTRKGFDTSLLSTVSQEVSVPLIASGGMGKCEDLIDVVDAGGIDGIAMADILHYRRATVGDIRLTARSAGIAVRNYGHS